MSWSNLGSGLAVACAAHCLALPLLVGASCCVQESPLGQPWVEGGILGLTGLVGYGTLGAGFREHRRFQPLALLTLGLGLMLLGHFVLPSRANLAATLAGAVAVVFAQYLNRRRPAACCLPGERAGDAA